jgi:hypothetical protein
MANSINQKLMIFLTIALSSILAENYTSVNYAKVIRMVDNLKKSPLYDKLFKVMDGFQTYKINQIPMCGEHPCQNPVVEVTDFTQGEEVVRSLPIVLLVAGFHGDEIVGTNALYYLIKFINSYYINRSDLKSLLMNVRLVIAPMINVNGFYNFKRAETINTKKSSTEEDPNRDFPYDQPEGNKCFVTSTARLLNAIFRENIIVGCLTFHGGDNSISYPWGNFAHKLQPISGDQVAFSNVAKILQTVAGQNSELFVDKYKIGSLHDVVYDVHGGFEDWGYGASFDSNNINKNCQVRKSSSFHLSKNEIQYNEVSNKAFLFLIEAGLNKRPEDHNLGNDSSLINASYHGNGWGHVTRNIHLALKFASIVGPHLTIDSLKYANYLDVYISVYGCLHIDEISVDGLNGKILRQKYNAKANTFDVIFRIIDKKAIYHEIIFNLSCDKNWGKGFKGQNPQSHLVRSRTDSTYSVNYKNNTLNSNVVVKTVLLNVQQRLIKKSLIRLSGRNIYDVIYTDSMTAEFPKENSSIVLRYKKGRVQIVTNNFNKNSQIHKISNVRFEDEVQHKITNRNLLNIKKSEKIEMSKELFLSLMGKSLKAYTGNSRKLIETSVFLPQNNSPIQESYNSLLIPVNGLSCTPRGKSKKFVQDNFLLTIFPNFKSNSLTFLLYSKLDLNLNFKIGRFVGKFSPVKTYVSKNTKITQNKAILNNLSLFDMRLIGRTIKISDEEIQSASCRLHLYDDLTDSPVHFGFKNGKDNFNNHFLKLGLALAFALILVFLFVGVYFRKRLTTNQEQILKNPVEDISI